jgi:hypothetical protein
MEGYLMLGKRPGEWYNPSNVSHVLAKANKFENLAGMVAMDRIIYKDAVWEAAGSELGSDIPWQKSVFVLVPVMLGL